MKTRLTLLIITLIVSFTTTQAQWTQIGQDIDGEAANNYSGWSVSLSSDGSVVAIGATVNDGNGSNSGQVRMYQNTDGTWTQIGQDIDGEAADNYSGWSVSLSADGNIVAIGAPLNSGNVNGAGHVRVYKNNAGTWTQIGSDIDGNATSDSFGWSVSLSSDGSIVAIGAYRNDGNGDSAGHVRVFQNNTGTWTQIGSDIEGEAAEDESGYSISLSSDGLVVAIGAPNNDGNGNTGHTRVYQNNAGTWTQIGLDIDGETENDYSGSAVSLNSDGSIVAIGSRINDGNGTSSGHVRVFKNTSGTWTQVGSDIDGEAAFDYFGSAVSLSSNGLMIAIGAVFNDGNGSNSGHVRIYENIDGTWTQVGSDINGEAVSDQFGFSVSLSSDGLAVAIGTPYNDGNGTSSGHVKVYQNTTTLGLSNLSKHEISLSPNPTNGIVNLKLVNTGIHQVFIYDITGKIIYKNQLLTINNQFQIDLSHFKKGVYFIKIKENNKVFVSKVIKE